MTALTRWLKFNLVGLLGTAVQLSALAVLHRLAPNHLQFATAAAVELTLLHNFLWHLHTTWRDRRAASPFAQLLRFHLSNGAVSLLGNLTLTPLLAHRTHLPLVAANLLAILCCSLANFYLSNYWTFALTKASAPPIPGGALPKSTTAS